MADDMFLELDSIDGESKDSQFQGKIDIYGFGFGLSNMGSGGYGGGSGVGKANINDISVHKKVDKASADLIKTCYNGKHIATGKIHIRKSGGDSPLEYLTYELTEVFVTSVNQSDSAGADVAQESITLNFSKIKMTYKMQSAEGGDEATPEVEIDVKQNKVLT